MVAGPASFQQKRQERARSRSCRVYATGIGNRKLVVDFVCGPGQHEAALSPGSVSAGATMRREERDDVRVEGNGGSSGACAGSGTRSSAAVRTAGAGHCKGGGHKRE